MHLPELIRDLAILLGVAALVTFVFRLIKQPVVLGYIIAGLIVGPHTPGPFSVSDTPNVQVWAELGVIFLMFSLGLEFSFRRLAKVGPSAGFTAIMQIIVMMGAGYICGKLLGWSAMDAIFLGCMVSISSTTIIIKALDELGLKSRRFAELVFGILIVEDLAAILMLVALTNIATTQSFSGVDLVLAGVKLLLVVSAWFVLGMFLVPGFVKSVSRHGTSETLTVVSIGLCLVLVSISAYFEYSVALGAFIMGSILAESREVHRIERLMEPVRDIFGAVFFVSVGMLLDPALIYANLKEVLIISLLIIMGTVGSVAVGALATGQRLNTALYAGLSLSQIGEFSFIIATLGLSYKVIDPKLYPIVVAASLITTFTTPYLLRFAPQIISAVERVLPGRSLRRLERYSEWFQNQSMSQKSDSDSYLKIFRWLANGIVVVTIFNIVAQMLMPLAVERVESGIAAKIGSWIVAFVLSSPFIWGMSAGYKLAVPKPGQGAAQKGNLNGFLSRFFTVILIGFLSIEFYEFWLAVGFTVTAGFILFLFFRKKLEFYYQWFEEQFASNFLDQAEQKSDDHSRFAPWDMHLIEFNVNADSPMIGQTLLQAQLREKYEINVVVIKRGSKTIFAPKAAEQIFPGDVLLCLATDAEIQKLWDDLARNETAQAPQKQAVNNSYQLVRVMINPGAEAVGKTIRSAGLHEMFDSIVVGMERQNRRFKNPASVTAFEEGDVLWLVSPEGKNITLNQFFQAPPHP